MAGLNVLEIELAWSTDKSPKPLTQPLAGHLSDSLRLSWVCMTIKATVLESLWLII